MLSRWRQAYAKLKDFVTGNCDIEIDKDVVAIPERLRAEFYQLFDIGRTTFIEENFSSLLYKSGALSERYTRVEEEVINLLTLDDVSMPITLHRFLRDPENQLIRGLFDPLFDLLRGKTSAEAFEEEASRNVENSFAELYRLGYEKWLVFSLVKLLEPNKSFHVPLRQPTFKEIIKRLPTSEELVLLPEESNRLSFEHQTMPILIVPDFIVYSAKIDKYIAVRSEFKQAVWVAANINEKRESYDFDFIIEENGPVDLKPGLIVYIDDCLEGLALIADSKRVFRPDLIVEYMEPKDWHKEDELENVKRHHDILKPKLGTYVVCGGAVPEHIPEKLGTDIHLLTVGFDQSKLGPIINALANYKI